MFIKLQWVEMNSCTCVHTDWPKHLIKDTWSCLTDFNRYLKWVHTHAEASPCPCDASWPWRVDQPFRELLFLVISHWHMTLHTGCPSCGWRQAGLNCRRFSSMSLASQCPLASTHRLPNKQTRDSNFMPSSLGSVPATGFALFIYSQPCKAPLGMFEAKVLDSQTFWKEAVILALLPLCRKFCIPIQNCLYIYTKA